MFVKNVTGQYLPRRMRAQVSPRVRKGLQVQLEADRRGENVKTQLNRLDLTGRPLPLKGHHPVLAVEQMSSGICPAGRKDFTLTKKCRGTFTTCRNAVKTEGRPTRPAHVYSKDRASEYTKGDFRE